MLRVLSLVAASCACAIAFAQTARADGWQATQVAGEVRVEMVGSTAVPLTTSMVITSDALIETAASGSATLVRGDDRIMIAPNSRLRLPGQEASGFTRIIEEFGELFFQVGKRSAPHFRVDTPLLAATVKGTSFIVAVDHKGTNVQVREGLVLVENSTSADSTYVAAGRSAKVAIAQPMDLYLDNTLVPPTKLRLGDVPSRHLSGAPSEQAPPAAPRRMGKARSDHGSNLNPMVPEITVALPAGEAHHGAANMVIDSTLSGIGMGILAAALAIVFIGTQRRKPGMVEAKPRRSRNGEGQS